ncbi:HutD family protein [Mycoplana dimorpha]|uniref:FAD/FMN-containing dehydrogenase n=1 Tax=Mycoplana dimorpha TaxID=28320 RepID=A0A2T5B3Q9_MYCDI|nr:HutD family protein [Mycoplana dimorpha]PTM93625.1 FAD/FMN-containing dehydrogenase [Mycoplana dimorpha]
MAKPELTILRSATDYKRMPWKNGGGETVEIAVFPAGATIADFDWRVSMATVASDGPFSAFPGIDRTLSILSGDGMALDIDGRPPVRLTGDDAPLPFPADAPTSATLLGGTITDLNVMTRRGAFSHTVTRLKVSEPAPLNSDATVTLILCHKGDVTLTVGDRDVRLSTLDSAIAAAPGDILLSSAAPAELFVVEIRACEAKRSATELSAAFLDELRAIVGEPNLKTGDAVANIDYGVTAGNLGTTAVALPGSTKEVAAVVKACAAHGVAIVTHGGRTGLVGGGLSTPGELVLSTAHLNRIERLSPVERVAVVEAGVTLQALQTAAAEHRLEPGIDLPSRGSATIGGMVSTNAGGITAFRYGVMRHRVLGMEAVLPDGSIYSDLTRVVKNSAGYDLKHLFIGAEGTLGIVTRIAVKLEPMPAATATVLFGLPSVEAALDTARFAFDVRSGHLRAAEAIWNSYFRLTAGHHQWSATDFAPDHPINLLISLGGADEEQLQVELERLYEQVVEKYPETSAVVATSGAQEADLWRLREDTDLIYRKHPAAPSYDVSVPLSEIDAYASRCVAELKAIDPALEPYLFGHLADGNLHLVLNAAGADVTREKLAAVEAVLYRDIVAIGGSFSAEHGIGSKRVHSLRDTADPVKLALMRQIKADLDTAAILNPGKVLG